MQKLTNLFRFPSNNLVDWEEIAAFRPLWVVELQAGMYKINDMSFLPKATCRTWERETEGLQTLGTSQFCSVWSYSQSPAKNLTTIRINPNAETYKHKHGQLMKQRTQKYKRIQLILLCTYIFWVKKVNTRLIWRSRLRHLSPINRTEVSTLQTYTYNMTLS